MRTFISLAVAGALLALTPAVASPVSVAEIVVADGDLPFCSAGVQLPDTDGCTQPEADYAVGRWARRHTHAGIPWVQETPPVHGWGIPAGVYEIAVPEGATDATLIASVSFGWDQSVPGGAGNDVELHVWADEARTELVATTFGAGMNTLLVSPHAVSVVLEPGATYYLQEDVAFGEHTWWLTNAFLTYELEG